MTTTLSQSPLERVLGAFAAGIVGLFAMFFVLAATIAVAAVGLFVALAALALRLAPRPQRRASGPPMLEARRTPEGWVAEAAPR